MCRKEKGPVHRKSVRPKYSSPNPSTVTHAQPNHLPRAAAQRLLPLYSPAPNQIPSPYSKSPSPAASLLPCARCRTPSPERSSSGRLPESSAHGSSKSVWAEKKVPRRRNYPWWRSWLHTLPTLRWERRWFSPLRLVLALALFLFDVETVRLVLALAFVHVREFDLESKMHFYGFGRRWFQSFPEEVDIRIYLGELFRLQVSSQQRRRRRQQLLVAKNSHNYLAKR